MASKCNRKACPVIHPKSGITVTDDFDLNEAVDNIVSWAGQYADEQGICPHVMSELLAMAASKARILTHYQEEHREEEGRRH